MLYAGHDIPDKLTLVIPWDQWIIIVNMIIFSMWYDMNIYTNKLNKTYFNSLDTTNNLLIKVDRRIVRVEV